MADYDVGLMVTYLQRSLVVESLPYRPRVLVFFFEHVVDCARWEKGFVAERRHSSVSMAPVRQDERLIQNRMQSRREHTTAPLSQRCGPMPTHSKSSSRPSLMPQARPTPQSRRQSSAASHETRQLPSPRHCVLHDFASPQDTSQVPRPEHVTSRLLSLSVLMDSHLAPI
jgi:hypothetical protein